MATVMGGNSTCHAKQAEANSPPLFQNGVLTFQAHHVGWIVSGFFTAVATVVSIWLINKHLIWYTNKRQQRQIVRLLLMVPIYAVISCLAYFFWEHALLFTLIRDCYESVILAAFFYLLLEYVAPSPIEQKEYFRGVVLDKWLFPLGFVKYRPEDGIYFLQLMKWGILQYCVLRPITTLVAVVLDMVGLYCEISWSPGWGHIYLVLIVSLSVSVAMYCLVQLYVPIAKHLAPQKPLLKLFAIKAIIFLMFWQTAFLSVLAMLGVVKDTTYMTADEINIGIAAIIQTFEMMLFSFLHVNCFTYKPYRGNDSSLQTSRWKSLCHALDFRDTWRETRAGSIYMWRKARGKEPDVISKRMTHFERVMGRSRGLVSEVKPRLDKPAKGLPEEQDLFVKRGNETQPSRGYRAEEAHDQDVFGGVVNDGHVRGHPAWWRGDYNQLKPSNRTTGHRESYQFDLTDLPPTSSLPRSYLPRYHVEVYDDDDDMTPPPQSQLRAPVQPIIQPELRHPIPNPVQRSDSLLGRMFNTDPADPPVRELQASAELQGPLLEFGHERLLPDPPRSPPPPPLPPKLPVRKRSLSPIVSVTSVTRPLPHVPREHSPTQNLHQPTAREPPLQAPRASRPEEQIFLTSLPFNRSQAPPSGPGPAPRRQSGLRRFGGGPPRPQPVMPTPLSPARYGEDSAFRPIVPGVAPSTQPLPGDLQEILTHSGPSYQTVHGSSSSRLLGHLPRSSGHLHGLGRPAAQPYTAQRSLQEKAPNLGGRSNSRVRSWRQSVAVQLPPDSGARGQVPASSTSSKSRRQSLPQLSTERRMYEHARSSRRESTPMGNLNKIAPPSPVLAGPPLGLSREAVSSLGEHSRYPAVHHSDPITTLTTLMPLNSTTTSYSPSSPLQKNPARRQW